MKKPLISVIMITYNQEKYVREAIESVLRQDYEDFELIISDDCSSDNTFEIINELRKEDKRIKVFRNTINLGPTKNVNLALRKANGDFISFLAGDDKFALPYRLRLLVEPFKYNKNLKIIYSEGKAFYPDGRTFLINETLKVYDLLNKEPKKILNWLYTNVSPLFLQGVLIRRDFLEKIGFYDDELLAEDYVLNIKIFQNIKIKEEYSYIKEITWFYRIHESNLHKEKERQKKLILEVIKKYTPWYLKPIAYFNAANKYLPIETLSFPLNILYKINNFRFSLVKNKVILFCFSIKSRAKKLIKKLLLILQI